MVEPRVPSRSPLARLPPGLRSIEQLLDPPKALGMPRGGKASPKPVLVRAPVRFGKILLAYDGSPAARDALAWAADLARTTRARVLVLIAVPAKRPRLHGAPYLVFDPVPASFQATGRRLVHAAVRQLRRQKIRATGVVAEGYPPREILRVASRQRVELVILGSHGHGLVERILLGGTADAVRQRAPCPVLITKTHVRSGSILAPIDGSRESRLAADLGIRLAAAWRAPVTLQHVFRPSAFGTPADAKYDLRQLALKFGLPSASKKFRYVLDVGHPVAKILDRDRLLRPRLIVMGSRGLGRLEGIAAGSVSSRVAHRCRSSVLFVKENKP